MRQYLPNFAVFLVLAAALIAGTWYVDKTFFPKPEPKPVEPPPPPRETVQALAGGVVGLTPPARTGPATSAPDVKAPEKPKEVAKPSEPPKATPPEPVELIALGDDSCFTKVLLSTRGGGIQQLTLTKFDEADRLGREVRL